MRIKPTFPESYQPISYKDKTYKIKGRNEPLSQESTNVAVIGVLDYNIREKNKMVVRADEDLDDEDSFESFGQDDFDYSENIVLEKQKKNRCAKTR